MSTLTAVPATLMVRSLPAAIHVRTLRHLGVTDAEISSRARLTHPREQLRRAARADRIGWEIERRILAVPLPNDAALYEEMRSVGARRRLRALHALGWPFPDLAAALDWPLHKIGNPLAEKRITVADHLAICALYDQRWTWQPEFHGVPADEAAQTRMAAAHERCHSPLAWDDEAIDDPQGRPIKGNPKTFGLDHAAAMRALDGDTVVLSKATRTHAITYGARYLDMPIEVMAQRLGLELATAKRQWERIKERARGNGETWVDAPRFTDEARHLAGYRRAAA